MKKLESILSQLARVNANNTMKIAWHGLELNNNGIKTHYTVLADLINAVEQIDQENIYSLDLAVSEHQFLQAKVTVKYLQENEVGYPLALVKIARNLKAISQSNYQQIDDYKEFKFWNDLQGLINKKLSALTSQEREKVEQLIAQ